MKNFKARNSECNKKAVKDENIIQDVNKLCVTRDLIITKELKNNRMNLQIRIKELNFNTKGILNNINWTTKRHQNNIGRKI